MTKRREPPADRRCAKCGAPIDKAMSIRVKFCSLPCRRAAAHATYNRSEKGRAYRRSVQGTDDYLSYRRNRYSENFEVERARVKRNITRVNEAARDRATRHGYEWTGPELEAVARYDRSSVELAEILGRTVMAIQNMRKKINRNDPKIIHLLGSTPTSIDK